MRASPKALLAAAEDYNRRLAAKRGAVEAVSKAQQSAKAATMPKPKPKDKPPKA